MTRDGGLKARNCPLPAILPGPGGKASKRAAYGYPAWLLSSCALGAWVGSGLWQHLALQGAPLEAVCSSRTMVMAEATKDEGPGMALLSSSP